MRYSGTGGGGCIAANGDGLEIVCRTTGEDRIYFVMNFTDQEKQMPTAFLGKKDLLSDRIVTAETVLKKYDVYIIKE